MPVLERDQAASSAAENAANGRFEFGGMGKAVLPVAAESATNQASLQAARVLGCRPGWEAIAERVAEIAVNNQVSVPLQTPAANSKYRKIHLPHPAARQLTTRN